MTTLDQGPTATAEPARSVRRGSSLTRRLGGREGVIGWSLLVLLVLIALLAPLLAPHSAEAIDDSRVFGLPSPAHPLGSDDLGRDVLSRILFAYRVSLGIAVGSVVLAMLVGVLAVLSLVGTALTARRRTRIVGAVALAPPTLLLGYVAVESLSLISATGVQIAFWADHLTATAGSLGLLAAGVGISSLLGLVAAAIWWWPPARTSMSATEAGVES